MADGFMVSPQDLDRQLFDKVQTILILSRHLGQIIFGSFAIESSLSKMCRRPVLKSNQHPPTRIGIFLNQSHFGNSYHLDTEGVIETDFGERRSMVSFSHAGRSVGLVITTTRPTAESELHLVEVRELIDGGMAHSQV